MKKSKTELLPKIHLMLWVRKLLFKLKVRLRKDRVEKEVEEQLQFHLESQIQKNIAAGMSREHACEDALQRLGNFEDIKKSVLRELFPRTVTAKIDIEGGTMNPFKVNYWAVLLAAMIYCGLGVIWYSGFRDSALRPSRLIVAFVGAATLSSGGPVELHELE